MTNTNLRLFAADMDGTLLDNDNAFNRRKFAEVIGILRRQQKKFVIATGNQTIRINKMFLPFDSDGQVISMVAENGAFIQNGQNLLHQSIIDPIKTKRIYDLLPTLNPRPTLVVFAGKDAAFAPTWQESVQVEGTRIFLLEQLMIFILIGFRSKLLQKSTFQLIRFRFLGPMTAVRVFLIC